MRNHEPILALKKIVELGSFTKAAEALEFSIQGRSRATELQIRDLLIQKGILIACIYRKGKAFFPAGRIRFRKKLVITDRGRKRSLIRFLCAEPGK